MINNLLAAIEQSDLKEARNVLQVLLEDAGISPGFVHDSLFPVVQRVRNPPFINPHLPKMYGINRELADYLQAADWGSLISLEVEEYTRREKAPVMKVPAKLPKRPTFKDIEKTISQGDVEETAQLLYAFKEHEGAAILARKLLLLGSGYLNRSLGHSISCSAFILLEMIHRGDEDSWPAVSVLAEYYCSGGFDRTPELQSLTLSVYQEAYILEVERAVSGTGIVALHHTITLYAIERCRNFFTHKEYEHQLTSWASMMKNKRIELHQFTEDSIKLPTYPEFASLFALRKPEVLIPLIVDALSSVKKRRQLGNYMIRGVIDAYNGRYNPHSITGLGSVLWLMETFTVHPGIVINGWLQYLDFFYSDIS